MEYSFTGTNNTAVGYFSLDQNTTGIHNTALGHQALESNTTANYNTAVGTQALLTNTTGARNVAVGNETLKSNTTGERNVAVGNSSQVLTSTGVRNSSLGHQSLFSNTTGHRNVAVGHSTLYNNSTGAYNTAVGHDALSSGTAYSNSTALGYDAEPGASNTIRLGNNSVSTIGGYANWTNVSDGRFKVNIREDVAGLSFIMRLRPVVYNLDMDAIAAFNHTPEELRLEPAELAKGSELQIGFIAQEVEQAAFESGFDFHGIDKPKNQTSAYGLRYAEFVAPLVKAIQEQQEIIQAQAEKIDEQDRRIEALENAQAELLAYLKKS